MRYKEILSDDQIEAAWGNANFGKQDKREVLKDTLIRCLAGYCTGKTSKTICIELGLIFANRWELTAKGRKYLGEYLLEFKQPSLTP